MVDVDRTQTARLLDLDSAYARVPLGIIQHQRMARTVSLSTTASQAMADVVRTQIARIQVLLKARVHARQDTHHLLTMARIVSPLTLA